MFINLYVTKYINFVVLWLILNKIRLRLDIRVGNSLIGFWAICSFLWAKEWFAREKDLCDPVALYKWRPEWIAQEHSFVMIYLSQLLWSLFCEERQSELVKLLFKTLFYMAPKCIYDTQFQNLKKVLKNLWKHYCFINLKTYV